MTPYAAVRDTFDFPFELRPYQIAEVNDLCEFDRAGYYWEPGAGKTAGSTHHALYWTIEHKIKQWLIVMPPILLLQWELWLKRVKYKATGKAVTCTVYAGGPPKAREKLDLSSTFVLVSYGILRNDFDYLYGHFTGRSLGLIVDEATAVKNHKSQTHKAVALLAEGRPLLPLTGTPINKPGDSYAYIKLIAPQLFRNHRHFEQLFVKEKDEYDNVVEWQNLDLLAQYMRVQTSRVLLREVRSDLPEVIMTPKPYTLHTAHLNLYKRIAEERLVEFADGREIDAISASALRSALQQIVVNWGEFDNDPSRRPAILDMIEETLEEIGERKLIVVANFRRSNRYLLGALSKYQAVAIFGDVTPAGKQVALQRFITDEKCRVLLLQPDSAGFGVDGLQHVCSDMLMAEAPTTPTPFEQVVKRIDRDGQTDVVHVRIAIAQGTVQVGMFNKLLKKDELANSVQRGYKNLRGEVYGEQ